MLRLLLVVILVQCYATASADNATSDEECQKRIPNSYTAVQKNQLCMKIPGRPNPTTIGPAICASVAKQLLHGNVKFETILQLCQGATSAAPIQCYDKMDSVGSSSKTKYGVELCAQAESTLPGECFATVSSYSGTSSKVKPEVLMSFCKVLEDRAPLLCLQAAKDANLVSITQALDMCGEVVGSGSSSSTDSNRLVANCIAQMHSQVKPSSGISGSDILKFCAETNPAKYFEQPVPLADATDAAVDAEPETYSAPADCYLQSASISASNPMNSADLSGTGSPLLTPKQRLLLCSNAYTAVGPINCALNALHKGSGKGGAVTVTGLKAAEVVELCHTARGAGPASCFLESRNLGTVQERIRLCNGATNAGPAQCYRRSANVFRNDIGNRSLLCVSAQSEDPAVCASSAPHYLALTEKVDLCSSTPVNRGQDSVKCLTAVEGASKAFKNGPKKALGYFLDSLWDARDRKSRELLVHMCSFSGSQDPLSSAECYKSAPNSLDHDDAARMCTDIPSTEVIQHMQLCHRLMPKDWASEEASLLCEQTTSREQVEAALKCAVEASTRLMFPKLSRVQAAHVCAAEQSKGPVLACIREVSKGVSASSPSSYLVTPEVLVGVCSIAGQAAATSTLSSGHKHTSPKAVSGVGASNPGACLAKLAAISSSKLILDSTVPALLCAQPEPASVLTCLDQLHKRMINTDDVSTCVNVKQEVKTMRVRRILTEDNGIEITAGKRFSLWFELLDQFGRKFSDSSQQYLFSASLNANNPQGAVLWGIRTNYSSPKGDGMLELNSLVISQSGEVDLKIFVTPRSGQIVRGASKTGSAAVPQLVEVFRLKVAEDPLLSSAVPCIYLLRRTSCPAVGNTAQEWESEFPRTRSYSPGDSLFYLRNIQCAGDALSGWHVNAYLAADASLWIEYKLGIDSIWTGVGMPKLEMSPMERLGLFVSEDGLKSLDGGSEGEKAGETGKRGGRNARVEKESQEGRNSKKRERALQKEIRRAYYRRSLMWHPDRWAGLSMYALAVQAAFELINEAYNALTSTADAPDAEGSAEPSENPIVAEDPVFE